MKRMKRIGAILIALTMMVQTTIYGASNVTVEITKNEPTISLSNEGERIFDIGYNFNVDFERVITGVDVALVLDRSNSMLRPDPSTGLPVADAVWNAVDNFVTEVYTTYPDSNVAIVSFGSNGDKSDGWNYYNNLTDSLNEIEDVYDYRDLNTDYSYAFRSYYYNNYRYAWENWDLYDGATNIRAGFEYAATTVNNKQVANEASDNDVIVLFTDGVATQGGSYSQSNYNYPTSHNSNTIAGYQAGIAAQAYAEVITVGYFEGIDYESTKEVARETLEFSQNAGMFEATQTGHLADIFDTIVEELNYIGTDATVVEIVEDEFEVVEGSILPEAYTLSVDAQGRQVITWDLGTVIDSDYTFGYQVKVKDEVFPTGSGTVEIPINVEAMLYYTDLDGQLASEALGQSFTVIPPRNNQPLVDVEITYLNNQYGYLVGDEININHQFSFVNEAPFDYREIVVNNVNRALTTNDLSTYLAVTEESSTAGWALANNIISYNIGASKSATSGENLEWSTDVPIKLVASSAGNFQVTYSTDYVLTNSVGAEFQFVSMGNDPAAVDVREGTVVLDLKDNVGIPITEAEVMIDGVVAVTELNLANELVVKGVPSGSHIISFPLPSGYTLLTTGNGITLSEDKVVSFETILSYEVYESTKAIEFERLNIKDISIMTLDELHAKGIDKVDETVDGKMEFTLVRALTKIMINMIDDFVGSEFVFDVNEVSGVLDVRNSAGTRISGFSMNGNRLEYSGVELPIDTYTAYGVMTPPSLGTNVDYDYNIDVDQIITREQGDTVDIVSAMTSNGLLIGIEDVIAPVIVSVHDAESSTLNLISQDITITDKTKIVTYEIYNGTLTHEEILLEDEVLGFVLVDDQNEIVILDGDIPVVLTQEPGGLETSGSITIYAVDAFGNYSLLVVEYENTEINDLLDEDLV